MNYINDIFLNFSNIYFDFFEWNKKDIISHLKKIPIIKISTCDLKKIIINKIILDNNFVCKYQSNAEYYNNNKKENIVVLCDGNISCAINFDNKGNIIKKSSLIIEDDDIACKACEDKNIEYINYSYKEEPYERLLTRCEKEKKDFLLKNIKKINKTKLNYLYYDCFNKNEDDINIIINDLIKNIENNNFDTWEKCFNFLNLIYQKNK